MGKRTDEGLGHVVSVDAYMVVEAVPGASLVFSTNFHAYVCSHLCLFVLGPLLVVNVGLVCVVGMVVANGG